MTTRLIIPCAGEQTRWQNYLGLAKYMAPVDGEPLLEYTVRKFREKCPELEIVASWNPYRPVIEIPGVVCSPVFGEQLQQHYKLLSSLQHWSETGRTFILFGDVFFSDDAMDAFLAVTSDAVEWFGRINSSQHGLDSQEIFGLTFPATQHLALIKAAMLAMQDLLRGNAADAKAWETYRRLVGLPKNGEWPGPNFHELNDLSEDFDTPEEYEHWRKVRSLVEV